jgi:hypothetical protein
VIEGAREDIISLSSFLTASAIPFPGSFPVAEPWRLSELSGGWSCKVPGDGSFTVALRSYVANFTGAVAGNAPRQKLDRCTYSAVADFQLLILIYPFLQNWFSICRCPPSNSSILVQKGMLCFRTSLPNLLIFTVIFFYS